MLFTEDISPPLKQVEEELTRAARLDKLTGLPNRGLFLDRLQHAIERVPTVRPTTPMPSCSWTSTASKSSTTVWATVSGTRCWSALRSVCASTFALVDSVSSNTGRARRVPDSAATSSWCCWTTSSTPADAATVAEPLLEALSQPYWLGKHEVYSTASIGIVIGDLSYERAEDVVRDADTAMYESKRLGRCRYTMFDASMRERVQRHSAAGERAAQGDRHAAIVARSISRSSRCPRALLSAWKRCCDGVIRPTGPIDPSEFVADCRRSRS